MEIPPSCRGKMTSYDMSRVQTLTRDELVDGYQVYGPPKLDDARPVMKHRILLSNEDAIESFGKLKLFSHLPWEKGYVFLAGGYVSRTILGDDPLEGDVDLFLYGGYSRDDVRDLLHCIQNAYKGVWWYRYGSVIVAVVPCKGAKGKLEIQIICTNHTSKMDVLNAFDASYVQCGYDGSQIYVTDDFLRFTPHSLAKITRPTCSPQRIKKLIDRGFTPIIRNEQVLLIVNRSKKDVSFMDPVTMDEALEEVNIHGAFNPYTELDYNDGSLYDIVPCTVTLDRGESGGIEAMEDGTSLMVTYCYWVHMDAPHYMHDNGSIYIMKDDTLLHPGDFIGKKLSGWKLVARENDEMRIGGLRLMANITTQD